MIHKGVKIFSWQVGKGELTPFALVLHPCGRCDHLVPVISPFSASISNRGGLHTVPTLSGTKEFSWYSKYSDEIIKGSAF